MLLLLTLACIRPNSDFEGLSNGQCPDLSATGISEFHSDHKKRRIQVVLPDEPRDAMPLVYSFHGLNPASADPITQTTEDNDLVALANELGVMFYVPEALPTTLGLLGKFLLWGILGDEDHDLVLFDDLQICATNTYDIDPDRISIWGHSGGALWTTLLTQARPEAFSAALEFSGGSDIELTIPGLNGPWVPYTGAPAIPYMLSTAGAADVWPDASAAVLDFQAATGVLEGHLLQDDHVVVRCEHDLGHYTIPFDQWSWGLDFLLAHTRGGTSPYGDGSVPILDGCALSAL